MEKAESNKRKGRGTESGKDYKWDTNSSTWRAYAEGLYVESLSTRLYLPIPFQWTSWTSNKS